RVEVLDGHPAGRPAGARDRRRPSGRVGEVVGVEQEERVGLGQPGDGHEDGLAVLERPLAHRQLGRVGVGLDRARPRPLGGPPQALGRRLGAREVRDAVAGAGEPGHAGLRQRRPHGVAQGRLGGEQVGIAARVVVVASGGPAVGAGHAAMVAAGRGTGQTDGTGPAGGAARPGAGPVAGAAGPAGARPAGAPAAGNVAGVAVVRRERGWRDLLGDARVVVSGFGKWGGGLYDLSSGSAEALDDLPTSGIALGGGRLWRVLRAPGEQTSTCELLSYDARGVRSYGRYDAIRDPHD